MKYIAYLIVPFILISLYGGCSDNGNSGNMDCFPNEKIVDSKCLAEDLLNVCEQFFCGATFPQIAVDFFFPPRDLENVECVVIDCNTLDCGIAGLFSDLEIWTNGMPTGLISFDQEAQFFCF